MKITSERMTSDQTRHVAVSTGEDEYGTWLVSWLPGRPLTRDQAISAMTLAEVVAVYDPTPTGGSRWWPFVEVWAAALGLTGLDAVVLATGGPQGGGA